MEDVLYHAVPQFLTRADYRTVETLACVSKAGAHAVVEFRRLFKHVKKWTDTGGGWKSASYWRDQLSPIRSRDLDYLVEIVDPIMRSVNNMNQLVDAAKLIVSRLLRNPGVLEL